MPPDHRSLRILRVADVRRSETGGASGAMLRGGAALASAGHQIGYLFSEDILSGRWPAGLRRLLVPWVVVGRVLQRQRAGDRFDVVEVHQPLAAPYCLTRRLVPGLGLPSCAVLCHGLEERHWEAQLQRWRALGRRPPLKSRIAVPLTLLAQSRYALRGADQVLVLNEADEAYLTSQLGLGTEKVTRVSNGVDGDLLHLSREAADQVRLLFLGSWIDRKGTRELVEACSAVLIRHRTARLSLLGVGVPEDLVRAEFPVHLQNRIAVRRSVGRTELAGALRHHDVLLLPSWFEGMPLAVLEGAAAGLAVVASDIAGVRDVFRPGRCEEDGAVLVPPSDAEALYTALERLIGDRALLEALQQAARERARSFTWEKGVDAYVQAYRRACEAA